LSNFGKEFAYHIFLIIFTLGAELFHANTETDTTKLILVLDIGNASKTRLVSLLMLSEVTLIFRYTH